VKKFHPYVWCIGFMAVKGQYNHVNTPRNVKFRGESKFHGRVTIGTIFGCQIIDYFIATKCVWVSQSV